MKFYVKYGCSECHETLIVEAESFERADEFAEGAAQDVYYSYDCNYPSEEDYDLYEEEGNRRRNQRAGIYGYVE